MSSSAPATPSATHWYLVHTKPRQEARALDNLQREVRVAVPVGALRKGKG